MMDNNDALSLFAVEGEELTADLDGLLLTAESTGALSAETVNELFLRCSPSSKRILRRGAGYNG